MRNRVQATIILTFLLLAGSLYADLHPRIALVIGGGSDGLYFDMLHAEIEGRLTSPFRYDLFCKYDDREPELVLEDYDLDAALFIRLVTRRDGSFRVEGDVYSGEVDRFTWSGEFELEESQNRFATAVTAAGKMVDALDRVFPVFGVIEFENRGYDAPYEVYINERSVGANPSTLGLLPGRYHLEIRRRDDCFEHVVASYDLDLEPDDYFRLVFSLERRLPLVPGLLRLASVSDGWIIGYEFNGGVMLPMDQTAETSDYMVAGYSSILITDVFFQKNIWGIETGFTRSIRDSDKDDERITVSNVPVMVFTGFQLGPMGGVDFVFRVGAGMNLSYLDRDDLEADPETISTITAEGVFPVVRGVFEFGVRLGERTRFSIGVQETTLIRQSGNYSWLGLQSSLGARF